MVWQFLLGMASGMVLQIPPLQAGLSQETFKLFPNLVPERQVITEAFRREIINQEEFYDLMSQIGFDKDRSDKIIGTEKQILNANETLQFRRVRGAQILDQFRSGQINQPDKDKQIKQLDSDFIESMKVLGFDVSKAEDFRKANQLIPGFQDIIRFAAKEVFEPKERERFGLDQEFPKEFAEFSEQIGLPPSTARDFWAAHWDNPSPQQIVEMYHRFRSDRGDIDEEDLKAVGLDPESVKIPLETVKQYFKLVEITPFWRDKLLATTFNPLTRVDVRRMFRLGVLNRDEVFSAYLDTGFSPKKAELMTQFTIKNEFFTLIEQQQNDILDMLEKGEINDKKATALIQETGATDTEADFLLSSLKFKVAKQQREDEIDLITTQFEKGVIDSDKLLDELGRLNVPATRQKLIQAKVERTKSLNIALPSMTDLKKWLKKEIINKDDFTNNARLLGHTDDNIKNYITEVNGT